MVRLPTVGGDCGTWGTVLNEFLSEEHDSDGTHGTITPTDIKAQGPWIDVRNYASFSAAITAIGSDNKTLLIPNEQTVSADVTVPANVHLLFIKGGSLSIDSGVTITINGPLTAGLYQIFSGDGSVSFGSGAAKEALPEWWGVDGVADDVQIQAALDSGIPMTRLSDKTYVLASTLIIDEVTNSLVGQGVDKTILSVTQTDGTSGIELIAPTFHSYIGVSNLTISGNSSCGDGIKLFIGYHYSLKRIKITGCGGNGLHLYGSVYYSHFDRIHIRANDGDGVQFSTTGGSAWPNANMFRDCVVTLNGGDGYDIDYGSGNIIIGGDVEVNTGWGIAIDDTKFITILGTWIENNTAGAIQTTENTELCYLMPAKTAGTTDVDFGVSLFSPASQLYGAEQRKTYFGGPVSPTIIPNLLLGYGNHLTLPASMMNKTGSATYQTDDRALNGKCIKLDIQNDYAQIATSQIKSPNFLKPGKYRFFVYAKSVSGTANALRCRVRNVTDAQYLFDVSVTPPAGDVFVPLPTGGKAFTIDDTEHGDEIYIKMYKALAADDANDIYISHVSIVPCEKSGLDGSDTWDPGSIAAGAQEAKEVAVSGAELGDFALASFSLDVQDLVLNAQVTAADTVTCVLANNTGGAVNLGEGTIYVKVIKR